MLTQNTRADLESELERLAARIAYLKPNILRAEARIEAIKVLLSPEGEDAAAAQSENVNPTIATIGLREAIRRALEHHPGGLRVGEVADAVQKLGYRPAGTMSPKALTYGEIYRMLKLGKLAKHGHKYRLLSPVVATQET